MNAFKEGLLAGLESWKEGLDEIVEDVTDVLIGFGNGLVALWEIFTDRDARGGDNYWDH